MLTDEEVWERYGDLIEEARQAFLEDPHYLIQMIEFGRRVAQGEDLRGSQGGRARHQPHT